MMNIRKIILEEVDDFDWIRDISPRYTLDFAIGKQMDYRENNLDELERDGNGDYNPYEIVLGKPPTRTIRRGWVISRIEDGDVILKLNSGGNEVRYSIQQTEKNINSGIWSIFDENGNVINDKKTITEQDDFDWIREIKPTLGEYFDNNMLSKGDALYLSGSFGDGNNRFIDIKNVKFIVEESNPNNFTDNYLTTYDKNVLSFMESINSFSGFLVESDSDLIVDKHIPYDDY